MDSLGPEPGVDLYTKVLAEKIKFRLRHLIPKELIRAAHYETTDVLADSIAFQIQMDFLKTEGKIEVVKTRQVPATLCDYLKSRWFPRWWTSRWPARFETIETVVHHYHVCPHVVTDTQQSHFVFLAPKNLGS